MHGGGGIGEPGGREAVGWGVFSKLCAKWRWRHAENFRKDSEDFL